MTEWFNAQELAEVAAERGVAAFPSTKSGVIRYAKEKGWDGSSLCRKREAESSAILRDRRSISARILDPLERFRNSVMLSAIRVRPRSRGSCIREKLTWQRWLKSG